MVHVHVLEGITCFDELTEDELNKVARIAEKGPLMTGQRVFSEGMHARNVYVLLSGGVEIRTKANPRQEPVAVATIKPGEIFGWSALTEPYTLTGSAVATKKSSVISIHGEALTDLCLDNNHLGYVFMTEVARTVGSRLRELRQRVTNLVEEGVLAL